MQGLIIIKAEGTIASLPDFEALYAQDLQVAEVSGSPGNWRLLSPSTSSPAHSLGWLQGLLFNMLWYGFGPVYVNVIYDDGTPTLVEQDYSFTDETHASAVVAALLAAGYTTVVLR